MGSEKPYIDVGLTWAEDLSSINQDTTNRHQKSW